MIPAIGSMSIPLVGSSVEERVDNTWWESAYGDSQWDVGNSWWEKTSASENNMDITPITSGVNADWTQGTPLYRPAYLRIVINSGPTNTGDYTQATFRVDDVSSTQMCLDTSIPWTSWDQDQIVVVPLFYWGSDPILEAIGYITFYFGGAAARNYTPRLTSISLHNTDPS